MSSSQEILTALRKLEESLVERLERRIDAFRLEMNGRFDAIEVRLDRLETEYEMIKIALGRIEARLDAGLPNRERLRAEVADLKARVAQLNARVEMLESKLTDGQA
jgi:chromosome segregation ATPase